MRKVFKTNDKRVHVALRGLAVVALTMSLAAFGCTTNRYPGNGEPEMGPMKTPTSTPGTSSGTTGTPPPETMVSSAPDRPSSADAIAILKANEAYRGKILGSVDPAITPQGGGSAPQVTGQYVPTDLASSPQPTANSSIGSAPVPVITSGPVDPSTAALTSALTAVLTEPSATAASTTASTPTVSITSATPAAGTTVPATAPVATTASTASSGTAVGGATAGVRVERPAASAGVVVTNQPQSLAQRFLRFIGARHASTAPNANNP